MKPSPSSIVLSRAFYPYIFLVFAIVGATFLIVLAVPLLMAWPFTQVTAAEFGWMGLLAFLGMVFLAIAFRHRTVWYDRPSGTITLSWGYRAPLVYRVYTAKDWVSFAVKKERPVMLLTSGNSIRTMRLPPRWRLDGVTAKRKNVLLGTFAKEADAVAWRDTFRKILPAPYGDVSGFLRLTYGQSHTKSAAEGWRDEVFFSEYPEAAKLYVAMGESGKWECVRAGNIYDADEPSTLWKTSFDLQALGKLAGIEDPTHALEALVGAGWFTYKK